MCRHIIKWGREAIIVNSPPPHFVTTTTLNLEKVCACILVFKIKKGEGGIAKRNTLFILFGLSCWLGIPRQYLRNIPKTTDFLDWLLGAGLSV